MNCRILLFNLTRHTVFWINSWEAKVNRQKLPIRRHFIKDLIKSLKKLCDLCLSLLWNWELICYDNAGFKLMPYNIYYCIWTTKLRISWQSPDCSDFPIVVMVLKGSYWEAKDDQLACLISIRRIFKGEMVIRATLSEWWTKSFTNEASNCRKLKDN